MIIHAIHAWQPQSASADRLVGSHAADRGWLKPQEEEKASQKGDGVQVADSACSQRSRWDSRGLEEQAALTSVERLPIRLMCKPPSMQA